MSHSPSISKSVTSAATTRAQDKEVRKRELEYMLPPMSLVNSRSAGFPSHAPRREACRTLTVDKETIWCLKRFKARHQVVRPHERPVDDMNPWTRRDTTDEPLRRLRGVTLKGVGSSSVVRPSMWLHVDTHSRTDKTENHEAPTVPRGTRLVFCFLVVWSGCD